MMTSLEVGINPYSMQLRPKEGVQTLAGSEVCKTCMTIQQYYVLEIAEARLNLIIKDIHYYKDFDIFSEFVQNEITPYALKLRVFSVIRKKIMSICLSLLRLPL